MKIEGISSAPTQLPAESVAARVSSGEQASTRVRRKTGLRFIQTAAPFCR